MVEKTWVAVLGELQECRTTSGYALICHTDIYFSLGYFHSYCGTGECYASVLLLEILTLSQTNL